MKIVRAAIAATLAVGAAAVFQTAASSPVSAQPKDSAMCTACWNVGNQ